MPGLVLSIGILVTFRYLGWSATWYTSGLGAHLSWALPFGLLIMFAVLGRLSPSYEEAAYDLGAGKWQTVKEVVVPIVFPGMIAVALFGFTLSYDEFPRSWLHRRLEEHAAARDLDDDDQRRRRRRSMRWVPSPPSSPFLVIALALSSIILIQRKRSRGK